MNPTIQDQRQPLPSILMVARRIEDYWESIREAGGPGPLPSDALDPFDAFLVHRLLELIPRRALVIDVAFTPTGGASSLIGLAHPQVRRVWAIAGPGPVESERAISALRRALSDRSAEPAELEVL